MRTKLTWKEPGNGVFIKLQQLAEKEKKSLYVFLFISRQLYQ